MMKHFLILCSRGHSLTKHSCESSHLYNLVPASQQFLKVLIASSPTSEGTLEGVVAHVQFSAWSTEAQLMRAPVDHNFLHFAKG